MHSLRSPWTLQAKGISARKSLLLASRLKHQQVCQPSDPPVCTGKCKLISQCLLMQRKTCAANTEQWLRQAQHLHKQTERGGTQRLSARRQVHRAGGPVSDLGQVSDDEWEEISPTAPDRKVASLPDRKSMQAIAMPKKKQGPGARLQTVHLQGGGRAWRPVQQEPKEYSGIGDYARRAKEAGVFDAFNA